MVAVLLLAVVIWLIPPPSGVQPRAWHLLAIFVATIVGIITKPLPMARSPCLESRRLRTRR
jgi:DASS family divalent anion:Na+ symporter